MEHYKLGVVVPVLNNFRGCVELFESIKTHAQWVPYIQPQWRQQIPLAAAWNRGIERAYAQDCDYVLVSNDDVLLPPYSLERLVEEYRRLENQKIIMVTICNAMGIFGDPLNALTYEVPQEQLDNPSISDHPDFSCFLIDRTFFDKVGTFDENFIPAWCEDNDMHYRIHLLGYRAVSTTKVPAAHIGRVSTGMAGNPTMQYSQGYFSKKWGSFHRNMDEAYKVPYNDNSLTPKIWIKGR